MQTTLKDIAGKLDLSMSTVSRALRDHPDVSDETKRKVKSLAKELDYHPDTIAQHLQKRTSSVIGVIVPQVKHFFFASVMSGMTDVAYEAGFTILISQSNENYEREVINTRTFISHRVAGFLISVSKETKEFDHFEAIKRRGTPLVFFDRVCESMNANKVIVDDYDGAFKAVEHLIESGYKKIAHLGGPQNLSIGSMRYQGFLDAMKKHGRAVNDDHVVFCGLNEEDGTCGFDDLIKQSSDLPDAIFAVTDPVAIGAYSKLKEKGLTVPGDIALVGFSDSPIASLIDPPLTSVRQPAYDMGKTAAELLMKEIENGHPYTEPQKVILSTELIIRKSTQVNNNALVDV